MAKRNPSLGAEADGASANDRIANLLALFLVKGMDTGDATLKLDAAGFSAADIARLLEISANHVAVAKYKARKAPKKKKKKG